MTIQQLIDKYNQLTPSNGDTRLLHKMILADLQDLRAAGYEWVKVDGDATAITTKLTSKYWTEANFQDFYAELMKGSKAAKTVVDIVAAALAIGREQGRKEVFDCLEADEIITVKEMMNTYGKKI